MKKTINYFLGIAGITAMIALAGCSKSSSSLPPINGYNSSNDVAKDNLKAHWTFDNTKVEAVSSVAPTADHGSSYTAGVIGQAIKLDSGYLTYPTISSLGTDTLAMTSFSVSLWFKGVKNNHGWPTELFAITQAVATQTDWNTGPFNMTIETGWKAATNDTIPLHPSFDAYVNQNQSHQDNVTNGDFKDLGVKWNAVTVTGDPWIHCVCVYDQSNGSFVIWANGVLVSNTNYQSRFGGNAQPLYVRPPLSAVVGGFPNVSTGFANSATQTWQGWATGTVDEIRVYNKALTPLEIGSLLALGEAGR